MLTAAPVNSDFVSNFLYYEKILEIRPQFQVKCPWLLPIQVRILVALPPRFICVLREKLFDNAKFLEFGG